MKNKDILTLVNGGILAATAHSLPVEHFYKWHKFRRALEKHYVAIDVEQKALMKNCGIDPASFNDAPQETLARFDEANAQLMNDEAPIQLPAPIPAEFYKGIYDENRAVPFAGRTVDIFSNLQVETAVLEYLFTDPDAEEGQE